MDRPPDLLPRGDADRVALEGHLRHRALPTNARYDIRARSGRRSVPTSSQVQKTVCRQAGGGVPQGRPGTPRIGAAFSTRPAARGVLLQRRRGEGAARSLRVFPPLRGAAPRPERRRPRGRTGPAAVSESPAAAALTAALRVMPPLSESYRRPIPVPPPPPHRTAPPSPLRRHRSSWGRPGSPRGTLGCAAIRVMPPPPEIEIPRFKSRRAASRPPRARRRPGARRALSAAAAVGRVLAGRNPN